jgi:hemerythrin-like domain-containing protein
MAEHLGAADGGDESATATILEHGHTFLDLLRLHIDKDDHVLFAMADQVVRDDDLVNLTKAYGEAESEPDYRDSFTRCRAIAEQLTKKYNVAKPQPA